MADLMKNSLPLPPELDQLDEVQSWIAEYDFDCALRCGGLISVWVRLEPVCAQPGENNQVIKVTFRKPRLHCGFLSVCTSIKLLIKLVERDISYNFP